MPPPSALVTFSVAAIVLFVIPGPAVLYVVARSVAQGRRAGLVSVAGIHAGSAIHAAAAVAGLSALLVESATAFLVVKWAGVAYLAYLGVITLRAESTIGAPRRSVTYRTTRRLFVDGVIVNVLNPKTALFFLAFVPQFVEPNSGSTVRQLVVLGVLFIALGALSDSAYVLAGARVSHWVRSSEIASRRVAKGAGLSYLGLGAWAALTGTSRSAN